MPWAEVTRLDAIVVQVVELEGEVREGQDVYGQAWIGLLLRTWPSWHSHHSPHQTCSAMWKVISKILTVRFVGVCTGMYPVLSDAPVLQTL